MRRSNHLHLTVCALGLAGLLMAGCGSSPAGSRNAPLYAGPEAPTRSAEAPRQPVRETQPIPAELERLHARLARLESDNQVLQKKLSDQYMQAIAQRQAELDGNAAASTARPTANTASAQQSTAGNQGNRPAPKAGPSLLDASEKDLLDALVTRIEQGSNPDRVKALMVAAMSVVSPRHELDHRLLDQLDPKSREQVARFHQMLAVTYEQLAADKSKTMTRREMIKQIDEVFGAQPLSIDALELCRRVDSYGVYEPFATTRFLAGRKNRVLIYVELENFMHHPTSDGQHEVRLEQQVELYDTTGETTVWRQGPVELVDVSRNKRRDFFIVYPIDLPARLPAGGYRLKVRLADKHTGSICEKTLHDIRIVADQSLVKGDN